MFNVQITQQRKAILRLLKKESTKNIICPERFAGKPKKGKIGKKKKGKRMIMKAYIDIDKMPRCLKINTIISNFRL